MDIARTDNVETAYIGLWTRTITSTDKKALQHAMEYLTCSFSFECKEIFVDNAFGYEIELPRIIID